MQPAHCRTIAQFDLKLFGEITVKFDAGPMHLTGLGGVFQNRHQQITHAFQFDFAPAARARLGDQGIDATTIKQLNPQPHHSICAAKLLAERDPRYSHQQRANRIEPNIRPLVGCCLHGHLQFLQRGVLSIGMQFRRPQCLRSTTSHQKVPAKNSFYPEIYFENRSSWLKSNAHPARGSASRTARVSAARRNLKEAVSKALV